MASESKVSGNATPFPYRPTWGLRKAARESVLAALNDAQKRLTSKKDAPAALVLVVDEFATSMLNSLFSASELSSAGFIVTDPLELSRQPYPQFGAVYFMRPTAANIDLMIADFNYTPMEDEEPPDLLERCFPCLRQPDMPCGCCFGSLVAVVPDPLYACCTMLAICGTTDVSSDKGHVLSRVSAVDGTIDKFTAAFAMVDVLYLEATVPEPNLFLLDIPDAFSTLHMTGTTQQVKELKSSVGDDIAKRLASVVYTLHEYPVIRYLQGGHSKAIAKNLALRLDNLYQRTNAVKVSSDGSRPTILVMDRVEDMITPFLHDFGYQSLCAELPNMDMFKPFKYEVAIKDEHGNPTGSVKKKKAHFNELDPVWVKLRHLHWMDAVAALGAGQDSIQAQQKEQDRLRHEAGQTGERASAALMRLAASVVTFDTALVSKVNTHTAVARSIADMTRSNNILYDTEDVTLFNAETHLARNEKLGGGKLTAKEAKAMVSAVLDNQAHPIVEDDQMRLLAVYWLASRALSKKSKKDKVDSFIRARLSGDAYRDLVQLKNLAFDVNQGLAAREAASSAAVRSMFAQDEALLQHTPYVADVAKVLLAGKLAEGELGFGEIDTMPPHLRTSASHTQASSGIAKAAGADQGGREESKLAAVVESRRKVGTNQNYSPATAVDLSALNLGAGDESKTQGSYDEASQVLIVFVTGGITFAEARALEAISATRRNLKIYYGSTNYLSPAGCLTELTKLEAANVADSSDEDSDSDSSDDRRRRPSDVELGM